MSARALVVVVVVALAARAFALSDDEAPDAVAIDALPDDARDAGEVDVAPSTDGGAPVDDVGASDAGDVDVVERADAGLTEDAARATASDGVDDARALVVDAVALILAVPAPSGVGALHTPLLGARAGFVWPGRARGPLALVLGVDGALLAGGFAAGTSAVRADRAAVVGLARGTAGARFGGSFFSLTPFASLAANAHLAGTLVRVDSSLAFRPLASAGAHAGFGLALTLGALAMTVESGIGVQGLGPSTTGAVSVGWRF